MGAVATVCSWNMNIIVVWAWVLRSSCALLRSGHGYSRKGGRCGSVSASRKIRYHTPGTRQCKCKEWMNKQKPSKWGYGLQAVGTTTTNDNTNTSTNVNISTNSNSITKTNNNTHCNSNNNTNISTNDNTTAAANSALLVDSGTAFRPYECHFVFVQALPCEVGKKDKTANNQTNKLRHKELQRCLTRRDLVSALVIPPGFAGFLAEFPAQTHTQPKF